MPLPLDYLLLDLVLFAYQVLMLLVHLHHLHAFEHPRPDTVVLFAAELLLCTRHEFLAEAWRLVVLAASAGLLPRSAWESERASVPRRYAKTLASPFI